MEKDECIKAFTDSVAKDKEKEWQKEKKERKEALMSHSEWLKLLQSTFNTFIRMRDKGRECISCGCQPPRGARESAPGRCHGRRPYAPAPLSDR